MPSTFAYISISLAELISKETRFHSMNPKTIEIVMAFASNSQAQQFKGEKYQKFRKQCNYCNFGDTQ